MSLYWFAGYLDQGYTINPVRLRGYDSAGHWLYTVRDNDLRGHDLSALAGSTAELLRQQADFADPYRFVAGYDEWGTAVTLTAHAGWTGFELAQRAQAARAIAVDSDGWIYCAMEATTARQLASGVTETQVRAMRDVATADGVVGGAYHLWNAFHPVNVTYYYDGLVVGFSDTNRYDRLYVDFFRVYRQNGDRVPFPDLHGRPVYAVATDDTYFYLAGEAVSNDRYYLRKYDKTGALQWSAEQPAWMGDEPPRYTAASIVFGVYVPEYWTFEFRLIHTILVDGSGNLYLSGHNTYASGNWVNYNNSSVSNGWLRKYNSSGVLQWERRCDWGATNTVTDGTLFYVAYYNYDTRNPCLPTQYQIDTTDYYFDPVNELPVEIVAWDADGDIVRTAARATTESNGYYYLDDLTGARRLEYHDGKLYLSTSYSSDTGVPLVVVYDTTDLSETTDTLTRAEYASSIGSQGYARFAFDASGARVFSGIDRQSPSAYTDSESQYISDPVVAGHFYRYDDAGIQDWTTVTAQGWAYPDDLPNHSYAEARDLLGRVATEIAIAATPSTPMLALGLGLATPSWEGDRYTSPPGLALPLALAIPGWLREYVGAVRLPQVYRLWLAGTPPLEFALTSLTLRRTAYSRQLTAVIQPPGVDSLVLAQARLGETLTLYRGVRFANGEEQLEVMMEVPLATARADQGPRALSLTIEGAAEEAENIPHTRALTGISYRSVGAGNQRRVRCAIDTYLRPGYTATFGVDSMTVGETVISISPNSGVMEVIEAAI